MLDKPIPVVDRGLQPGRILDLAVVRRFEEQR
jgi:hypothetical protein